MANFTSSNTASARTVPRAMYFTQGSRLIRVMPLTRLAMMREPKVVMFDEPTANLSPKLATQVLDTVKSIAKDRKLTVVLVEQNARKALQMADRAYLLVGGRNVFEGGGSELLSHAELAKMYLGLRGS